MTGTAISAGGVDSAASAAREPSSPRDADPSVDAAAESAVDSTESIADALARRVELVMLATQSNQQRLQARLDRLRAEFNATAEERSERMREQNMLRDMAMEQAKADNEILKKYITMI
jgi:hypothetical protein